MRLAIAAACLIGFIGFVHPNTVLVKVPLHFGSANELALGSGSSSGNPMVSIINGVAAKTGDFPFMASLWFPLNATMYRVCGGTLIGASYVLTAAHCVNGLPNNTGMSAFAFINTLNATGGGNGSFGAIVSSYIAHQQFYMNTTHVINDIALLVLSAPAPANFSFVQLPTDPSAQTTTTLTPTISTTTAKLTTTTKQPITTTIKTTTTTSKPKTTIKTTTTPKPTTKTTTTIKTTTTTPKPTTKPGSTLKPITTSAPVCSCTCPPAVAVRDHQTGQKVGRAAERTFSSYSNQPAVITGWGVTASGSLSWTLQKANVTVYDNINCTIAWSQFNGATQICAAQTNTATCSGDSGGPLLVAGNIQVGIVSFGASNCADPVHIPVFTRVSAFLTWIASTIASNPPPAVGK